MDRPQTPKQLWSFIGAHFGLWLPRKVFTQGHSSPFKFVSDAFLNPGQNVAAWANRGGLKTLDASILAATEYAFLDGLQSRVLAGSLDQARQLYAYWEQWCHTVLRHRLQGDPGRLLTRVAGGKMQILTASQKQVRGGRFNRVYRDEEDEIPPDISSASVGTLTTLPQLPEAPGRFVVTSTWHYANGPMAQLVQSAEDKGYQLHKWNLWESLAQCPVERHSNGKNCEACPLGKYCLAKARERNPLAKVGVASQCEGLLAIHDAIKQAQEWSEQQFEAEALCERPALTGLVYPQFDRRIHVKPDLDFDEAMPTYRAIDWGINGFVCLWIQTGKSDQVFVVDEYLVTDQTVAACAKDISAKDKQWGVHMTYCDPAGRQRSDQTGHSDIQVMKAAGVPCRYRTDSWATTVANGIQMIRAYLKPAAGQTRLHVAGACKELIRAFESYKLRKVNNEYIDEPVKPQSCDHPMDALRYFFVNRLSPPRASSKQMGYT